MKTDADNLDNISISEKYRILIAARNFHYSNFSKWMTYFYVATAALFVGYCTIVTSQRMGSLDPVKIKMIELFVLSIGYIVSIFWYWSAKGYYYWNINFIELVNYYEETLLKTKVTERVYKVFFDKQLQNNYENPTMGGNFSTSKIAIFFAFVMTSFWGLIILATIYSNTSYSKLMPMLFYSALFGTSILATTLLTSLCGRYVFKSKNDDFPDLTEELKKNSI